jgi:hypothetical protein
MSYRLEKLKRMAYFENLRLEAEARAKRLKEESLKDSVYVIFDIKKYKIERSIKNLELAQYIENKIQKLKAEL